MAMLGLIGALVAMAGTVALLAPLVAVPLRSAGVRLAAFIRRSPAATLVLAIPVAGMIVYGATKTPRVVVFNYHGIYDGQPHFADALIQESDGAYLLAGVFFSENPNGPFIHPQFYYVDAGEHVTYYQAESWFHGSGASGQCIVSIKPRQLEDAMVGQVEAQMYTGAPVKPSVSVADGNLLTSNDYVVAYSDNVGLGMARVTITGTNNYAGTVTREFEITVPSGGEVKSPVSLKVGRKATWSAKADVGSVFAGWSGDAVDAMALSGNQRRNPRLTLTVGEDFDVKDVASRFIPISADRLSQLGLERTLFNCGEDVDFALTHDSLSYLTAKVSGLPAGFIFDAANLRIRGVARKPGIHVVKISASNASGYAWSENVQVRVADLAAPGFIDFSGMPSTATKGEFYEGTLVTDLSGYAKVTGLPDGVKFHPETGRVEGTPKKAGVYVVWVTQKFLNGMVKEATLTITVNPWTVPEPVRRPHYPLSLLCSADQGAVVGVGVYPEGRKVKIAAKPAKGMAFAGWYLDAAYTCPLANATGDYRDAAVSVEMAEALRLFARFVPEEEAVAAVVLTVDGKDGGDLGSLAVTAGVREEIPLSVDSITAVKTTVSGLPSGLKYDAKTGVIAGVATRAVADRTVSLKVTVAGTVRTFKIALSVEALPAWVCGAGFFGSGSVDDEEGVCEVSVSESGRVSGRITTVSGKIWSISAAGLAEFSEQGASRTPVTLKCGKASREHEMWLWAEDFGEGRSIGRCLVVPAHGVITVAGDCWQSAFARKDLEDAMEPVKDRVWKVDTDHGTIEFKCGNQGQLSVRGKLDGVSVTGGARLIQTGWDDQGTALYRASVRLAPKGGFRGMVWSGMLDSGGSGRTVLPPNVVTTVEDVVDPNDGVTSLREAFSAYDEVRFALPAESDGVCRLKSTLVFNTSKAIDGEYVVLIDGSMVTNRVTISGDGKIRLFKGGEGSQNVVFRNLILENATASRWYGYQTDGAVVLAKSDGTVTFDNCVVRGCHAEGNGAVVNWCGPVVMMDSVFQDNRSDHMGGVVCLNSPVCGVSAHNCIFTGNQGETCAGVFRVDGDSRFDNCRFVDNQGYEGGVVFGNGSYCFNDCVFSGNRADWMGNVVGTYLLPGEHTAEGKVEFHGCTLQGTNVVNLYLQPGYNLIISD